MLKELHNSEFSYSIEKGVTLIDFYASWCGPCKMLMPKLEEISEEFPEVIFYKMNVDENSDIVDKFLLRGVPTVIIFKDGIEIERIVGNSSKENYMKVLEKAVSQKD